MNVHLFPKFETRNKAIPKYVQHENTWRMCAYTKLNCRNHLV